MLTLLLISMLLFHVGATTKLSGDDALLGDEGTARLDKERVAKGEVGRLYEWTEQQFDASVAGGDQSIVHLIAFVTPWCGHCKRLSGTWQTLAKLKSGRFTGANQDGLEVHVGRVDCTAQRSLCERFTVKSFPTLKAMWNGRVYEYTAKSRQLSALVEFVEAQQFLQAASVALPRAGERSSSSFVDQLGVLIVKHVWLALFCVAFFCTLVGLVIGMLVTAFCITPDYAHVIEEHERGKNDVDDDDDKQPKQQQKRRRKNENKKSQ
jgi:thiol-disulfide isomerase/thioredoxin